MDTFSEAYENWIDVIKSKKIDPAWQPVLNNLAIMLQTDGPDPSRGTVAQEVRDQLNKLTQTKGQSAQAKAEAILAAADVAESGFQERAAFLKSMQHFYLVEKIGAQSIWVCDPPKAYNKWMKDQFAGQAAHRLADQLCHEEEVFGESHRQTMADAVQHARKWCTDVQIRLALADDATLAKVRLWFHDDDASEIEVKASVARLLQGFKQLVNGCNARQIIFSDLPQMRAQFNERGTVAAVAEGGEAQAAVYLFEPFLEMARIRGGAVPKLWLCITSIIHELTHILVGTEDFKYGHEGMRPGIDLSQAQALKNAESWSYFAADLLGQLKLSARMKAVYQ